MRIWPEAEPAEPSWYVQRAVSLTGPSGASASKASTERRGQRGDLVWRGSSSGRLVHRAQDKLVRAGVRLGNERHGVDLGVYGAVRLGVDDRRRADRGRLADQRERGADGGQAEKRRRRPATIVVVIAALALACSGGPVSLDAGPPPRPVLRVHRCEAPRCELFRAAECTLVQAEWNPAAPELHWPEHLGSMTYRLAPSSLVTYVPRTEWPKLRGAVPTSLAADFQTRLDGQPRGANAASTKDLVKALGRPNLYLEEAPGKGRLFYAFLDDSVFVVRIAEGKLDGSEGSFSTN